MHDLNLHEEPDSTSRRLFSLDPAAAETPTSTFPLKPEAVAENHNKFGRMTLNDDVSIRSGSSVSTNNSSLDWPLLGIRAQHFSEDYSEDEFEAEIISLRKKNVRLLDISEMEV